MSDVIRRLQDRLYTAAKSDAKRRFHSLRDKVLWKETLERAWKDVKKNHGTSGPDGLTIEDIEGQGVLAFLEEIQSDLTTGKYRPGPLLRVDIPKRSGGTRPLGIPNVRDRVVQAAVKLVIEPVFEAEFQECSFGYRPNRGPRDATKEVYKWLNYGLENVIDADIEHCFDEIPHDKLMKAVSRRIADGYVLKLIRMWLKAPVLKDGTLCSVKKGTPQGGVISPLLANIYLHQLDEGWTRNGMTNRWGCNAQMVRYADDLVILSDRALDAPLGLLKALLTRIGLKLSEKKTRLVTAEEGFEFLGFRFIRRYKKKWGKRKTYRFPSPDAVKRVKEKIRKLAGNHVLHVPPDEVAASLNRVVVGWRNYFRHSNASRTLSKVSNYLAYRFRKYLRRRKNKSGMGKYRDMGNWEMAEKFGLALYQDVEVIYD